MRITLATLAAIALIGSILLAQSGGCKAPSRASTSASAKALPPGQMKSAATHSTDSAEQMDAAVEARLDEQTGKVDFSDAELSNALAYLTDGYGINIVAKWQMLSAAGIDKTCAVNVHLNDVTLRKVLRTILEDVGGANPLEYCVEGGAVIISTRDHLARHMVPRIYDVRDILFSTHNSVEENEHLWSHDSLGVQVPRDVPRPGDDWSDNGKRMRDQERDLLTLLTVTVDRDSWVTGSGLGSIASMNGRLVITQNYVAHKEVAALIEMLREPKGQPVGIAGVHVDSADAAKELQSLVGARPADMETALHEGEDKGKWSLDKCDSERYGVQCVNQTSQRRIQQAVLPTRTPSTVPATAPAMATTTAPAAENETVYPSILDHYIVLGYQAAAVDKGVNGDASRFSVTCESAWVPKDASFDKDTPECNTSIYHRHHIFEIDLKPGEAKVFPVIPVTAKDGGIMVVVYLPKK